MANSKRQLFLKRRLRVRNKLRRVNAGRLRLSVHRSKQEHQRPVDRRRKRGHTGLRVLDGKKTWCVVGKNNIDAATKVGSAIAERAQKAGVKEAYFDRGGFLFHGKIKALGRCSPRRRSENLSQRRRHGSRAASMIRGLGPLGLTL